MNVRRKALMEERLVRSFMALCAAVTVTTTIGIIVILFSETVNFFQTVSLEEFFTSSRWTPLFEPKHFGILPLLSGTLMIALGSGLVALPLGLGSAIFLSEYAPSNVRRILKPVLEILAGIPTVVYGFFALTFISPLLRSFFPATEVFNAASASIVVGIMTLPMVASLCDDALRSVPRSLRDAGYALGATKSEVASMITVPAALSGIIASFILALSRAVGETMAVTLAAGSTPNMTTSYLESIQTMTAYIVQVSLGDTPHGTISYQSIFAVGTVLFVMTMIFNLGAQMIVRKYRWKYE